MSNFDDPKVPGVTCFISQARKGGWGQPLGLNEDPSNFSVACRQLGPITTDLSTLPEKEEAFSEKTSIFFKATRIYRVPDVKRNALIYLAVSSKVIEGSPANAISVVPIMPVGVEVTAPRTRHPARLPARCRSSFASRVRGGKPGPVFARAAGKFRVRRNDAERPGLPPRSARVGFITCNRGRRTYNFSVKQRHA